MLCALAVAGLTVSFAAAQAQNTNQNTNPNQNQNPTATDPNLLQGRITGINGGKVSFQPYDTNAKKFGDVRSFDVGEQVQFFQMQGDKRSALTGGLKADPFQKIGPNGQWATFRLNNNNLSEIQLMNTPAGLSNLPPIPKTGGAAGQSGGNPGQSSGGSK